jgi:ACS family glucarate transporter-like MFS transporter
VAGTGLTLTLLILARFLVGAAHAPIFPVQNSAFSRWFPPGNRALPLGLSSTALTLGLAATAPLLSWLVVEYGWRIAFCLLSPTGLLVAGLWWWYGRDRPADHPAMTAQELAVIEGERGGLQETEDRPPAGSWKRILKNRDVLLLMASYSCMNFIFYQVFNYFYQYLVEQRGFDEVTAGWVTSSQWIAGAIGAAFGGWLCDRLSRRFGLRWGARWPIIAGLLLSGGLLLAGSLSTQADVAVILFIGCFLFNQITEGAYWSASISIGGRLAGTAGGVMNTGANLMGIVNANLVPLIAHALGWTSAIASGALFGLLGAVFMLGVRADKRADLP